MNWLDTEQHRKYHQVCQMLPLMEGAEFDELKGDIATNGLIEAIWLHPDGSIVDGRNRHRACIETETEPRFRTWDGSGSLVSFVVSMNLKRRHLTSGQRATIALDMLPALEQEAKERQGAQSHFAHVRERVPEDEKGRARDHAAELFQTNPHYVSDAKTLKDEAPDLFDQVKAGQVSLKRAKTIAGNRQKKEQARQYAEQVKDAPPLQKVYNVLYADPPWSYGPENPQGGTASAHYATMELDEICDYLKAHNIKVAENSVLFLWVTNPFLRKALRVIESWGFDYKTNAVWVKTDLQKPGSGYYVRGHHELLFIATRGSFTPLDKNIAPPISSVIYHSVGEHSEKPQVVYDLIERLYPNCVYLELFARNRRRGWDCLGVDL